MTELINKVTKALQPNYQLVVSDIPEQYINVPQNKTKSTQCIEIRKDNETYIDFLIAYSIHGKHKHSDATLQLNKIGSIHKFTVLSSGIPLVPINK